MFEGSVLGLAVCGKVFYEGDIIKVSRRDTGEYWHSQFKWSHYWMTIALFDNFPEDNDSLPIEAALDEIDERDCDWSFAGNIFDNPELLGDRGVEWGDS